MIVDHQDAGPPGRPWSRNWQETWVGQFQPAQRRVVSPRSIVFFGRVSMGRETLNGAICVPLELRATRMAYEQPFGWLVNPRTGKSQRIPGSAGSRRACTARSSTRLAIRIRAEHPTGRKECNELSFLPAA